MKEISIYHNYGSLIPLLSEKDVNSQETEPFEEGKSQREYLLQILYTIYKYRSINKAGIESCLNFKNKNSWKRKSLKKALKLLRDTNYIRAYGTKEYPSDKNYNVVIYIITKKGALLLEKHRRKIDYDWVYDLANLEAKELLKQASMSQYHISLIRNYGYLFEQSKFYSYKTRSGIVCPSMVSFHKKGASLDLYSQKLRMVLYAFPAPKDEDDIEEFSKKLLQFVNEEVLDESTLKLILIVCESTSAAGFMAWKLNQYRQMRPFPIMYIQDRVTAGEDPLSNIIYCETDEEGIRHSNINFFKR